MTLKIEQLPRKKEPLHFLKVMDSISREMKQDIFSVMNSDAKIHTS